MALRKIIAIDEDRCVGCGACIPNCPEGALQIIGGKARLVGELFCDGLGACIGHCPFDAISVEEREAEPYEEARVMQNLSEQGENVVIAHLRHLEKHGESGYLKEALGYLEKNHIRIPEEFNTSGKHHQCPGSMRVDIAAKHDQSTGSRPSQLEQWPIQLHLVSPDAYREKDVLLCADCVAYAAGDFHRNYLKGKGLAIACPKLDSSQDTYSEKLTQMIPDIKSLTVMIMQVPCCRGLLSLAMRARDNAGRKIPIRYIIIGIEGEVLEEKWIEA